MGESSKPKLVAVQGPTASGKSGFAIRLALRFDGEIVNADSLQRVRHFDIGTAKPTPEESARIAHHLFDAIEPAEPTDAGRYLAAARPVIAAIAARGRVPVVVGGTGLYVRALLYGLVALPPRNETLRSEYEAILRTQGREALVEQLLFQCPDAPTHIDCRNPARVVRALEVLALTGQPIWRWQAEHRFAERPYEAFSIALNPDPDVLAERIARRSERMVEAGLVEEVKDLLRRFPDRSLKPYGAIGYRQVLEYLGGGLAYDALAPAITRATWHYARKQLSWLRTEKNLRWMRPEEESAVAEEIAAFLARA
ncbi:MAG: tRNA (adenosine(37)-N6)-dimethylallyltransferase MiaA [Myxococcales bacterium]|nr:MAG: tRNA (adenosine(37)-N6)-dimethylallyltransferase MiaA [Myxococcales bacterium]